ncbi:MAG: hypothetical protein IPL65_07645 [Lewinellaceae bacterium]|nr:hypothetical protein [Lewinellaceae bacterium]
MKQKNNFPIWSLIALLVVAFSGSLFAQDDLYYDPERDVRTQYSNNDYNDNSYSNTDNGNYDDAYYDYEDDYAYQYSSRIRRFHRGAAAVGYYDPFFVDMWFYDPFYLPGASIYIGGYNDYWAFRNWRRFNRFNRLEQLGRIQ